MGIRFWAARVGKSRKNARAPEIPYLIEDVPRADIMKHIVDKCPNVSFVLDSRKSDFMLEAWGWSGNYKFTVFQKGGQAVYSTSTVLLSNAVKDVCKFVNSQSARDTG